MRGLGVGRPVAGNGPGCGHAALTPLGACPRFAGKLLDTRVGSFFQFVVKGLAYARRRRTEKMCAMGLGGWGGSGSCRHSEKRSLLN